MTILRHVTSLLSSNTRYWVNFTYLPSWECHYYMNGWPKQDIFTFFMWAWCSLDLILDGFVKLTLQGALNEFDTETRISFENSKIICIATQEHAGTHQPRPLHIHNRDASYPDWAFSPLVLLNFLRMTLHGPMTIVQQLSREKFLN